jgi:hypothetical protein
MWALLDQLVGVSKRGFGVRSLDPLLAGELTGIDGRSMLTGVVG